MGSLGPLFRPRSGGLAREAGFPQSQWPLSPACPLLALGSDAGHEAGPERLHEVLILEARAGRGWGT